MKPEAFHQKQRDFLLGEIKLDRLSHAYLFAGEPGTGKKKTAEWFIDQLRQQVDRSWDFQVWRVYPEYPEKGGRGSIGIDQMREMRRRTELRIGGSGRQVIVIHEAQSMTAYAQDALLKVLEEPKNQTVFVLLADHMQGIRPTVRSRCQLLQFPTWGFLRSMNWLVKQGVEQNRATTIALLSQGRLDFMLELKDNPRTVQAKLEEWKKLHSIQQKPLGERFRFAEKTAKERDSLGELLGDWLIYWRAMLLAVSFGLKIDPAWQSRRNLAEIAGIIEQLEEVETSFRTVSLNKRLALEQILISFDYAKS